MSSSVRTLPVAVAVIFGLALFAVYTNIYSIADSNTQSTAELVIPVLEPADEEPATEQSGDDTPTPDLSPVPIQQSPSSEAAGTFTDPWASERMEAASKAPFIEELKKPDENPKREVLLRGAPSTPTSRLPDPVSPRAEPPSLPEETATAFQDPVQPLTGQYTDPALQPALPQTSPPDSPATTETTPLQPPLDLPPDKETASSQPPPDLPAGTETAPRPPVPPHAPVPARLSAGSSLPPENMIGLAELPN
jgi:hypothetical protein